MIARQKGKLKHWTWMDILKCPIKFQSENQLLNSSPFHFTFCEHLKLHVSNSSSAKHCLAYNQKCLRPHHGLGSPSAMSLDLVGKTVSHPRKKTSDTRIFPQVSSKLSWDATAGGQGGTTDNVLACTTHRTQGYARPKFITIFYLI